MKDPKVSTKEKIRNYQANRKNRQLRNELVRDNLGLVGYTVRKYSEYDASVGLDMDDLFGYGVFGLMRAIDKFDPNHGTEFSTYAIKAIRSKILKPVGAEKQWSQRTYSSRNVREDDNGNPDVLEQVDPSPTPEERMIQEEKKEKFWSHIASLLPLGMTTILRLEFRGKLRPEDIGLLLHVSRSTIYRLRQSALEKLRTDWLMREWFEFGITF